MEAALSCPYCRGKLRPTSKFCPHCGQPVRVPATTTESPILNIERSAGLDAQQPHLPQPEASKTSLSEDVSVRPQPERVIPQTEIQPGLGEFIAEYRCGKGKVIVNSLIALVWFILGLFIALLLWESAGWFVPTLIALAFFSSALAFALFSALQRLGRSARLYQHGIELRVRGASQTWRFDQLDGIKVKCGKGTRGAGALGDGIGDTIPGGGLVGALVKSTASEVIGAGLGAAVGEDELVGTDINCFEFFQAEKSAFKIGSTFIEWKQLGEAVYKGVLDCLLPKLTGGLARGELLVFKDLHTVLFSKNDLALSTDGLHVGADPLVPWDQVPRVVVGQPKDYFTIELSGGKKDLVIKIDDAMNALIASNLIRTIIDNPAVLSA